MGVKKRYKVETYLPGMGWVEIPCGSFHTSSGGIARMMDVATRNPQPLRVVETETITNTTIIATRNTKDGNDNE